MRHKKETFKGKSKLPSSSNWGEVLLSRLRVNPGLFLSADLSSFVPHKWTHLIDFLSTWITSIAVNMGRQIPLLPSRWGLRRVGVAAGEAQHNGGCSTLLTAPCAFPRDSAELPESWHSPQGPGGGTVSPLGGLGAAQLARGAQPAVPTVGGQLHRLSNSPTSSVSLFSYFLCLLPLILCDPPPQALATWRTPSQP